MPEINVPLLDRVLAQIEAHPETWKQAFYRCDSGMCFAGWAAELAGGKWVADPKSFKSDLLESRPEDDSAVIDARGQRVVSAHARARQLLGLDAVQASILFDSDNDIDDIRDYVAHLKSEAAEQSSSRGSGESRG